MLYLRVLSFFLRFALLFTAIFIGAHKALGEQYRVVGQSVLVSGEMHPGMTDELMKLYVKRPFGNMFIRSGGGDLEEAIKLYEFIGKYQIHVIVEKDTACLSSCAFAALADKNLKVDGVIGFHMPFVVDEYVDSVNMEDANRQLMYVTMYFFGQSGFSNNLITLLMFYSSRDQFVVFTDETLLNQYRDGGLFDMTPSDFEYVPESLFKTLTTLELYASYDF